MKRNIYCLIVLFLAFGCANKHKLSFTEAIFPETIELKGEVVMDTFIMGACYDMEYYNHKLWVVGYVGEEEEDLHIFDANNGAHLKSLYPKGRGPGEAVDVPHINIDKQTGWALFYDYNMNRIHYFQADSVMAHSKVNKYLYSSQDTIGMSQIFWGKENYIGILGVRQPNGSFPRIFLIEHDAIINEYDRLWRHLGNLPYPAKTNYLGHYQGFYSSDILNKQTRIYQNITGRNDFRIPGCLCYQ